MKYKLNNGHTLEIILDECPESPREWDNVSIMMCSHKRYSLGDVKFNSSDFQSWDDVKNHILKKEKALAILPIYMYDHSGITISSTPFSCAWDSGQIGFAYITQAKLDEMGIFMTNKESWADFLKRLEKMIEVEIHTYDQFLQGEVYGYRLLDENQTEIDSCWGFYGNDFKENDLLSHINPDLIPEKLIEINA